MMKPSEQTTQQIERFLKKIAQKFPANEDTSLVTDVHIRVSQDTGEKVAFVVFVLVFFCCFVEQWIGNTDEDFYDNVECVLHNTIATFNILADNLGILKPYSFVLENDD